MSGLLFTFAPVSMGMGVVAITIAIMIPLNGVVTRLRAQYNPKHLRPDPKCDKQPNTGPVITSFFAMLARVRRIEGWSGLYKGLMPTLLDALMSIFVFIVLFFLTSKYVFDWKFLFYGIWRTLLFDVSNLLVFTPLVVLTNRAITTRHNVPYASALDSLQVLLTPTERRYPWVLCQTSGLSMVGALQGAYFALFMRIRERFPRVPQIGQLPSNNFLLELTLFFAFALASTLVLTPLQVIFLKLSLQRNDTAPEYICHSMEEGNATEAMGDSGTGENVISLRIDSEAAPYTGLIDCAIKIINEEGWGALYRAWWWTTFTLIALS